MSRQLPIVLRPSRVGMVGGLLFFVAAVAGGVLMIATAESLGDFVGGIGCVVGGGMFLLTAKRVFRFEPAMVLDRQGMHVNRGGLVAWGNLAELGEVRIQTTVACLGVRLHSYTDYASTFSPRDLRDAQRHSVLLRFAAVGAVTASATQDDFLRNLANPDNRQDLTTLLTVPGGAALGRQLAWNRSRFGWDLLFPRSILGRKTGEVMAICRELQAGH